MLKEFKAFLLRGNVVDLAVAVVIGAAFGGVVSSFVANLLTPLIAIPGTTDFSSLRFKVGGGVFFLVVKPVNSLMARLKTQPDVESPTKACPECLSNIPSGARRCAFCTATVS
jgi:large conductance mechanosensitive channel